MKKFRLFLFLLGIVCVGGLLLYADLRRVSGAILDMDKNLLVLAVLSMFPFLHLRALRWYVLLHGRSPFSTVSKILYVGTLTNAVLPFRAGGFLKAYLLHKTEKKNFGYSFGSVFLDNIVVISYVLISSIVVFTFFLSDTPPGLKQHMILGGLFFVGIIISFLAILGVIRHNKMTPILKRIPILKRFGQRKRKKFVFDTMKYLRKTGGSTKSILAAYSLTALVFLNFMLANYLLVGGLGYSLPLAYLFLGSTLPIVLGLLSTVPGGLGVQEISMTGVFTAAGLPVHIAVSAIVLFRIIYLVWTTIFGLYGSSSLKYRWD